MRKAVLFGAVALLALSSGVRAAEIEVKMLNKGSEGAMVFEPSFIKAEPGDTVKFIATDKGHNAVTVPGMLPDGVAAVTGKIGQDLTMSLDKPGVYGIKCTPHYGMGMVALIVVGTPTNQDAAKAVNHPGRAKQVFATLFNRVTTQAQAK